MKANKQVKKPSSTKDRSQGSTRSKGGGRLDGKAATTNLKRNVKGSVRYK